MSRGVDKVEQGKVEEEKGTLRRSRRKRKTTVTTESDSTEVETDTEAYSGWNIGDLFEGDKTVVEKNPRESPESVHSFGELSNTAYFNHKFDDNPETSTPSFKGVVRREKEDMSKEPSVVSVDSGLGKTADAGMGDFLRWMAEEQKRSREEALAREDRYREDQLRREAENREDQIRRDAETKEQMARQQLVIEAMMARTQVKDTPRPTPIVTLPKLKEGGDVIAFITAFETALRVAEVHKDDWKTRLVSSLPVETLVKIDSTLTVEGADYSDIIDALKGGSTVTFCSAAEDLSTAEKGKAFDVDVRATANRFIHLHNER